MELVPGVRAMDLSAPEDFVGPIKSYISFCRTYVRRSEVRQHSADFLSLANGDIVEIDLRRKLYQTGPGCYSLSVDFITKYTEIFY